MEGFGGKPLAQAVYLHDKKSLDILKWQRRKLTFSSTHFHQLSAQETASHVALEA